MFIRAGGLVSFGCAVWCGSSAAATSQMAGYSSSLHYVTAANVTGGSGQCLDKLHTYYTSTTYYPGPGKPGETDWRPVNQNGYVGEFVAKLPPTPAAGVTHWSGTYTSTLLPAGTVTTVAFVSDTIFFDRFSAAATVTYTYPVTGGGTCNTTLQINFIPTGR